MRKRRVIFLILALALLAALATGCKVKKTTQPPVVLIIIDTLRADHVGCYGYERPITPALDTFAKNSIRFANAHAAASWTVPSMTSLFTSVYPWQHGVVYAEVANGTVKSQQVLSDQFQTMAESLKDAGYTTFGVSANYHMHEQYGMSQGFDHYKAFWFKDRFPVDKQIKRWLPKIKQVHKQGKPYFLYVHYFDPHHPYKFNDPYTHRVNPEITLGEADEFANRKFAELAVEGFFWENPDKMQLLIDLYDGEIAACDHSVGRLLKHLPGIEDAVVVITSDHGEAFGEHQNMIHGRDLYGEEVRVPLMIKLPKQQHAGMVIDHRVSLIDVFPTLAAMTGADAPDILVGIDLAPLWAKNAKPERLLFSGTERVPKQVWYAAIGPRFKLINLESANRWELYDIVANPGETENVFAREKTIALEYRRAIAEQRRQEPLHNPGITGEPMSDELRDTLKGLGYL